MQDFSRSLDFYPTHLQNCKLSGTDRLISSEAALIAITPYALPVQGEIRPPMEISMGHGIFHGPWKFPWALEISRTWNFPWAMEISMGNASITAMEISRTWKFPVAYLLGGHEVPSISEWFETITFKERSKGEHYRIQLKFVALRKLSLSIERLKLNTFEVSLNS